ncbi:MAG: hypothetical protein MK212_21800 [Saprospiraceae bacterium]|nr:hypothetical protein [Saprospiraceae bacterium]
MDNFFLYSKYVYHKEGVKEGVDIINSHFAKRHRQEVIELGSYDVAEKNKRRKATLDFESTIGYYLNDYQNLIKYIRVDYDVFFSEVWDILPCWSTFSLLRIPEANLSKEIQNKVLSLLYQSVKEGWISILGIDSEPRNISILHSGRCYIDSIPLITKYHNRLGEELSNIFVDQCYIIEENTEFVHPDNFWKFQVINNPRKVVHILLYTIFEYYYTTNDQLHRRTLYVREARHFAKAAVESIQLLCDSLTKEELMYYPKYAGYTSVIDPKQWLLDLVSILQGKKHITTLQGKRLLELR